MRPVWASTDWASTATRVRWAILYIHLSSVRYRVLQQKGPEGRIRKCDSHTEHEQGQNNLLTMRKRKTGTYMGVGEWATGGGESWSVHSRCMISTDCPDHELPNMTGQHSKRRREGTLNRDIYILGAVNNTNFLMVCVVPLALLYPIYIYIYIYIYVCIYIYICVYIY